jgi:hypothetical protein
VALVTSNPQSTTTTRLKAELEQLGVRVVVIVAGRATPVGRISLENVARTAGAFAAVRVVPVAAEVEVWVADRVTGKTVVREVIRGRLSATSVDDTIALGAVELLRASLLEVTNTPDLQHGEVAAPPVVQKIAPPPEPQTHSSLPPIVSVAFEPTVVLGFDNVRASLGGGLAARYSFTDHLALEGLAQLPIAPAPVRQRATGEAKVSASSLGLGLSVDWNAFGVTPSLGAGMLGIWLQVNGKIRDNPRLALRESEQLVGVPSLLRLAAPYVRGGAAVQVLEHLRLRADATALYTLRAVPIRFVGEEVASWGRPSLLIGAGLEVLLPR